LGGFLQILANVAAHRWVRFRNWLTVRRVLAIVALLVLMLSVPWLMEAGADVAFLLGLDLGLVAEVTALLIIFSVRDHIRTAAGMARHRLALVFRPVLRYARRARRTRRNAARGHFPPREDDGPGWACALHPA